MSADEIVAAMESANLDDLSVRDLWRVHAAASALSNRAVKVWAVEAKRARGSKS